MGSQGPMRPGSFPGGPPNNMYGSPHHPGMNMAGMNMGNGGPGPQMGSYGGMRPMGMNQFNGQMGPGYMPGAGGQVKFIVIGKKYIFHIIIVNIMPIIICDLFRCPECGREYRECIRAE